MMTLADIYEKYSIYPEFLGTKIESPNQAGGITDDTLMHLCVQKGSVEEVAVLIENGGEVNALGDLGYTPLHYAAMRDDIDVIKLLLKHGANEKARNEYEETPLDVARLGNKHQALAFLGKRQSGISSGPVPK